MMIGLKDRPDEVRLQGVDIVNDPALHKLAVDALAAQPRDLHCRQTDRLTDGTPLYRCLITQLTPRSHWPTFLMPTGSTSPWRWCATAWCWPPAMRRVPTPTLRTMPVAANSRFGVE